MNSRSIVKGSALIILVLFFLVGCDAPEVQILISPEYQSATIQVDFIRVDRSKIPIWMGMNIDDYFSPGSQFRDFAMKRGDVHTIYYNIPQKAFVGSISGTDPIWERFEFDSSSTDQEFDVVILADLPGSYGGSPVDIRRKIIPLRKKAWDISLKDKVLGKGLEKLTISITSGGILIDPAPVEE